MQSSSYYKGLMEQYKKKQETFRAIKAQITALYGPVSEAQTATSDTKKYTDSIIIMGESMDQGSLSSDVEGNLNKVKQNLDTIVEECDKLIKKYTELYNEAQANYNQALAEEKAAAEAAAKAKQQVQV